jgi:hypothetical protein
MSKGHKQQATLVKVNGDRLQAPSIEAVQTVTALDSTVGEHLLNTLLEAYHFTPSERSGLSEDEPIARYSEAKLKAIGQSFKDREALIKQLESKIKAWRGAADLIAEEWQPEFTNWALGLAPTDGEMEVITDGVKIYVPISVGVTHTVGFLFDCLATLSNSMMLGESARTGKNGRVKNARPSIFDNPKKGVETASGNSGNNENWGMRASARYAINNGVSGQKLCKAIELVAVATKLLNNGQVAESEKQFKILTGQIKGDTRYNFNPSLIKGLITLRGYGLLISGARKWVSELRDKESEASKNSTWLNIESTDLADMVNTLNRKKAFDEAHSDEEPKPETVGGSKAEAPDTKATLPQGVAHPITWKDKAERRLRAIASKEYGKGISDEDIALMIHDLVTDGFEVTEESFNTDFSEDEIKEYFKEVAFKEVTAEDTAEHISKSQAS